MKSTKLFLVALAVSCGASPWTSAGRGQTS